MEDKLTVPEPRELPPGRRRQRAEHLVAELTRTRHDRRRRPVLLTAILITVVLAAGAVGFYAGWGRDPDKPVGKPAGAGAGQWRFSDPQDMVATSHLVVLGRVIGVERGPVSDQQDVVYTSRLLHVAVEERLFGKLASDRLVVEDFGWEKADGREVPWRVRGFIRLEVGDRAFLFLREDRTTGRYEMITDQGAYRVQGAEIADSDRTDPMVRRIEGINVAELERLIVKAADAVKRGKLEPTPPGGRRP